MKEFIARVMVADDHPAVALGVVQELSGISTVQLVDTALNSTDLITALVDCND